jgi:hypothetical protein
MSNNESSGQDVKNEIADAGGVNNTAKDTKVDSNDSIPRARLNEEIAKRKELDAKVLEFEKAKELEDQKKLEEKGNYETVLASKDAQIADLAPYKEKFENLEKSQREEELSKMSEEDRETFGDLPIQQIKAINQRFEKERSNNSAPVQNGNPSARQFADDTVQAFEGEIKGLSSKQRQQAWQKRMAMKFKK